MRQSGSSHGASHSVGANAQTLLAGYSYGHAANGQRVIAAEANGRASSYSYDARGRLEQETISGDPSVPTARNGQIGYVYDAVGNRLSRTRSVARLVPQAFGYDANDRVQGDSFSSTGGLKVFVALEPCDLRQSFTVGWEGLCGNVCWGTPNPVRSLFSSTASTTVSKSCTGTALGCGC